MIRHLFRRYRTASIAVTFLVALLLTGVIAELAARSLLNSRIAAAAGRALGDGSEVEVAGGPALLDLYDRHLDRVTIAGDHAGLGRLEDVVVRAQLEDLRLSGGGFGTVARTSAVVEVPAASIQRAVSAGGMPVTGIELDAADDTLTLALGRGGLGQATLRPELRDGRLSLHLEEAAVLGRPAPEGLMDQIRDGLAERDGAEYPLGLEATSVDVTDTGLAVTLSGGPAQLPGRR